jgi:hypothetical protein
MIASLRPFLQAIAARHRVSILTRTPLEDGDDGYDLIAGFSLAQDRLWFDRGFFATEPLSAVELRDVLMVFDVGAHAVLAANTASQGWIGIAELRNVDASIVGQMIEDESILLAP